MGVRSQHFTLSYLICKITPFDEYLTYQFEEKLNPTMDKSGSLDEEFRSTKKVGLKLLVEELFSPKRLENIETHELVMEMGKIAAQTFMREFRNTKKATSKNFSGTDGPYSWAHLDFMGFDKFYGITIIYNVFSPISPMWG